MKKLTLMILILAILSAACSKDKKVDKKPEKKEQKAEETKKDTPKKKQSPRQTDQNNVDIDSIINSYEDSFANSNTKSDTLITSSVDSAGYKRIIDSLKNAADQDYEERKQNAKEKADFINNEYQGMWTEATSQMQFLANKKTASQIRARAQKLLEKSMEVKERIDQFEAGDPRRQVLEEKASFYENIAGKMRAAGGNDTKRRIVVQEIKEELQAREDKKIEIDF